MTPSEHYRESERLIKAAAKASERVANLPVGDAGAIVGIARNLLAQAQVHATLAQAGWLIGD